MTAFLIALAMLGYAYWLGTLCKQHVDTLAARITSPADKELFRRMYTEKQPRSVMTAWWLSALLTPTAAYIYQQRWGLAAWSFITLEGLGLWWAISLITMPMEVLNRNKLLADKAFNEVLLIRGESLFAPPPKIDTVSSDEMGTTSEHTGTSSPVMGTT